MARTSTTKKNPSDTAAPARASTTKSPAQQQQQPQPVPAGLSKRDVNSILAQYRNATSALATMGATLAKLGIDTGAAAA